MKKIRTIYSINNNKSFNKSSINQDGKTDDGVLLSEVATMPKKVVAHPPVVAALEAHTKEGFREETASPANHVKPTIVQDMLRIWNTELERDDKPSKHLSKYLVACYQWKFGSSLEK